METVIQEEIQRANKSTNVPDSEAFGNHVEPVKHSPSSITGKVLDERTVEELEREIMDLKITNRGKNMFILQLNNEGSGLLKGCCQPTARWANWKQIAPVGCA